MEIQLEQHHMNHEDIEVKKAAIERLKELNELYYDSTDEHKRGKICQAIMALVRKELNSEFHDFRNIKVIDDAISGTFDLAFKLWEKEKADKTISIRNGGSDYLAQRIKEIKPDLTITRE